MSKKGILLINLGTPNHSDARSVRQYLKQFLNDPRVVDLPVVLRSVLVNLFIVPFRYQKSAEAYQQVWTEQGSPLLVHSNDLAKALAKELGAAFQVELGMRYGNPSIESALYNLKECIQIAVIPLFPQYSSAANGSTVQECLRILASQWNIPETHILKDFFNHPSYIQAYANVIQEHTRDKKIDLLLMSYHGLPERHIAKSVCKVQCSRVEPCPQVSDLNAYCYRAQCFETSRLLAKALNLDSSQYQVTFQSRLGRTPWIKPYTDLVLPQLIEKNIKNIAIVCPSFVSDCLETLEEINIRARKQWQELGGREFTFIPCINDNAIWVDGLVDTAKQFLKSM